MSRQEHREWVKSLDGSARRQWLRLCVYSLVTPWRWPRRWICHQSLWACGQVDPGAYAPFLAAYTAHCDNVLQKFLLDVQRPDPPDDDIHLA